MANQFIDLYYLAGGGRVGLLRPGLAQRSASVVNAYTQEPCVLRFTRTPGSTTDYIRVGVAPTFVNSPVESYIHFDLSETQYWDMTEALRHVYMRTVPGATPVSTGAAWQFQLEEYDSGNNLLGSIVFGLNVFDAVEPPMETYDTPLPDTFRLIADATLSNYETECVRATYPGTLEIYGANGSMTGTYSFGSGNLTTAGWRHQYNSNPTDRVILKGSDIYTARVQWLDCKKDKAMVRWWSPLVGGYKSVAVDLRSSVTNRTGEADFLRMFQPSLMQTGTRAVLARIPLCTMRDAAYYSDIFLSDEVEVYWNVGDYNYPKRVKIDGTPPVAPKVGTVDIDFNIVLSEVGRIW